jgi:hypothetical protein
MSATDEPDQEERVWENGWEGHEQAQRLRMAKLPFWIKLEWLEEAHRIVRHLEAGRKSSGSAKTARPSDSSIEK